MNINLRHHLEKWEEISKDLKAWEVRFIELRNEGMGYIEISEILRKEFRNVMGKGRIKNFHSTSLRDMLSTDGRLKDPYETYSQIIAMDGLEQGRIIIKRACSIAASTLVALLSPKQPGAVRLAASNSILDRNIGKAIQKIEREEHSEVEEMKQKLKGLFEIDSKDGIEENKKTKKKYPNDKRRH